MLRYKLFCLLFLSIGFFSNIALAQSCSVSSTLNQICQGTSSTLEITTDITNPTSFIWNNSETTSSINVYPTSTSIYSCIISNGVQTCTTPDFTLNVTPNNTIALNSSVGTNNQSLCNYTTLTNISYSTSGATGASASGLPSGVSGILSGNEFTISGTPSVSGIFNYTVSMSGGCGSNTASGTINVLPNNTITLNSSAGTNTQSVCVNSLITNITYATSGATSASVTGLPAGVNGNWTNNEFTISGTPTTSGTFNYIVSMTGGCGTNTASGTINVLPNNTITLNSSAGTNTQSVCVNSLITNITYATSGATSVSVTGLPAGVNGNWTNNEFTISGTPTTSGTFNYTVSMTGGCGTNTDSGTINVLPNNTITLNSSAGTNTQSVCVNSLITNITYATSGATSVSVTGLPAGVNGNWTNNVFTISGTPTTSGTFNFTVSMTGGCGTNTASGTINVLPNNTITLNSSAGTNTQSVCVNSLITNITYATSGATSVSVTGLPAGVNGNWTNNVFTISGTPTTSGTFNFTVSMTGGCGTNTASGTITVTPNNTISLISNSGTNTQTLCINTALTNISYSTSGATSAFITGLPNGVSGIWSSNVFTISGTPTISGVFNFTVTMIGGCIGGTNSVTGVINVNSSPVVFAGNNSSITCAQNVNGVNIGMSPNIGIQYLWSPINGLFTSNSSSTFANPNTSTNYTLTAYNPQNGCYSYDTVLVTVNNSVPIASAGNDGVITCNNNISGILIGSGSLNGIIYSWSPSIGLSSSSNSNPTALPLITTNYSLTVLNPLNGCMSSDQVLITVNNTPPIVNAGMDAIINCNQNFNGLSIGMSPTIGIQYNWSPINGLLNSNLSSTFTNPTATTNYILTATNPSNGCSSSDNVTIIVDKDLPIVNAGPNASICSGEIVSLFGMANSSNIQWSPSFLISNPNSLLSTATIQSTTTFNLTAVGQNGCSNTDYVTISVNQAPVSGLNSHYDICTNDTLHLNINPSFNCQWSGLFNSTTNTINQNIDSNGLITLILLDSNGCSSTEEITINALPIPYPSIAGKAELCQNSYWEKYTISPTPNFINWGVYPGEFMSINNLNEVFIHWDSINSLFPINAQIWVTETIASTGCKNKYIKNIILDTNYAPNPADVLSLSSNVLYTTQDYFNMNWGYESIVTHIPVYLGVSSQYCNYTEIDLSSYYYWVEIDNGNGCKTKSYFNAPTFTSSILELESDIIEFYPNPCIDFAHIKGNLELYNSCKIVDLNGQLIQILNLNNTDEIDLRTLKPGMYFVLFEGSKFKKAVKLIKQ